MQPKGVKGFSTKAQEYQIKYTIQKMTGMEETAVVEVVCHPERLGELAALAYQAIDTRLFLQGERYREGMELTGELSPEVRGKVQQIIYKVNGMKPPEALSKKEDAEGPVDGQA